MRYRYCAFACLRKPLCGTEPAHLWLTSARVASRWAVVLGVSAALAVRGGMTPASALRALTLNNAKILELDHRIGSLEPGKDADFIVLSGDPLSVYTQVEQTFVEGQRVFDLYDPTDHLFAVGGLGASAPVARARGSARPRGVGARGGLPWRFA